MYYILTRKDCEYCDKAKQLLVDDRVGYSETNILADPITVKLMIVAKLKTVPQIWCDNEHIGGYTELREHLGLKD
jgi:glutathione-dependent peroxiredoxin